VSPRRELAARSGALSETVRTARRHLSLGWKNRKPAGLAMRPSAMPLLFDVGLEGATSGAAGTG
jgi:hypothetical protein